MLEGAYLELSDLLALRHRPPPSARLLPLRRGLDGGLRLSRQRGRGVDFAEVRAYQAGDDIRSIDWRVTARKNKPHTKVFREERERPTFIVVDQTQTLFFGSQIRLKSVAAAEVAGLAFWHALANNDRVGGLILHNDGASVYRPRRSAKQAVRFLSDLAKYNQRLQKDGELPDTEKWEACLSRAQRVARMGHRILFISDFQPDGEFWLTQLTTLAHHNDVTGIQIYDPLEAQLPESGEYTISDGHTRLQFDTGSKKVREIYAERFRKNQGKLSSDIQRRGIRLLPLATTDPLHSVQRWF